MGVKILELVRSRLERCPKDHVRVLGIERVGRGGHRDGDLKRAESGGTCFASSDSTVRKLPMGTAVFLPGEFFLS